MWLRLYLHLHHGGVTCLLLVPPFLQMLHLEVSYCSSFSVIDTPPHPTPPPSAYGKVLKGMGGVPLLFLCLDTMGMRKLFWNAVIVLVYIKSIFAQLYQRHSGLAYWYMACVCMQIRYCSMCAHVCKCACVMCARVCVHAHIGVCLWICFWPILSCQLRTSQCIYTYIHNNYSIRKKKRKKKKYEVMGRRGWKNKWSMWAVIIMNGCNSELKWMFYFISSTWRHSWSARVNDLLLPMKMGEFHFSQWRSHECVTVCLFLWHVASVMKHDTL